MFPRYTLLCGFFRFSSIAVSFTMLWASIAFLPLSQAQTNSPQPATFLFVYSRHQTIPFTMHAPIFRNIYSVTSLGGKEQQLTDDNHSFGAALSPDGNRIAYIHLKDGSCENCFSPPEYEIYVMNADGRDVHFLAVIDGPGSIRWSPDSKMLAFGERPIISTAESPSSRQPDAGHSPPFNSPLYLLDPNKAASPPQKLFDISVGSLEWSPDGNWLAFGCLDQSHRRKSGLYNDLYICVATTGEHAALKTILPQKATFGRFSWSPDSTRLAYFASGSTNQILFVVDTKDFAPRSLTDLNGFPDQPAWSPDGKYILVSGREKKKRAVFLIDAVGSGGTSLTNPKLDASHPMWSADGKSFVFTGTLRGKNHVFLKTAEPTSEAIASASHKELGCMNVAWLETSSFVLLTCGPQMPLPLDVSSGDYYLLDLAHPSDEPRLLTKGLVEGISFAAIPVARAGNIQ